MEGTKYSVCVSPPVDMENKEFEKKKEGNLKSATGARSQALCLLSNQI